MHIPSEMLHGAVCPVTAAFAVAGVGLSLLVATRQKEHPGVSRFSSVTTLVFALQMLNVSIGSGLSGHVVGGVLASALLGVPYGVLSLSIVLTIQTFLFADGGLLMLGANVTNMALLGAGVGGVLYLWLKNRWSQTAALAVSAVLSVILAVLGVEAELISSGNASTSLLRKLLLAHIPVALLEGVATVLFYNIIHSLPVARHSGHGRLAVVIGVIVLSVLAAPLASEHADALEGTLGSFHLLTGAPNFVHAPMTDYQVSFLSGVPSLYFAAFAGCVAVFLLSWGVGKILTAVRR